MLRHLNETRPIFNGWGYHVVDSYAAALLQIPALPLLSISDATLSPMEIEFFSNNRRVSNSKIKAELKPILQYPSYREGLKQLWQEASDKKNDG